VSTRSECTRQKGAHLIRYVSRLFATKMGLSSSHGLVALPPEDGWDNDPDGDSDTQPAPSNPPGNGPASRSASSLPPS